MTLPLSAEIHGLSRAYVRHFTTTVIHYDLMADEQDLFEYQWDQGNLHHLLIESPHGVTPELCDRLKEDQPKFLCRTPGTDANGKSHDDLPGCR